MPILNKKIPIKDQDPRKPSLPPDEPPKAPDPEMKTKYTPKAVPLGAAQKYMDVYGEGNDDCEHSLMSRREPDCDRFIVYCIQCDRELSMTLTEYYGSST